MRRAAEVETATETGIAPLAGLGLEGLRAAWAARFGAESTYLSLSAVARAATGTRWNGPRFFGLRKETL